MADHCKAAGIAVRPHVKVHKSVDVARRQIARGAIGLTCATMAEAELMSGAGIKHVLWTKQPAGVNNISRAVALSKKDPTFMFVVDDPRVVDWVEEASRHAIESVRHTALRRLSRGRLGAWRDPHAVRPLGCHRGRRHQHAGTRPSPVQGWIRRRTSMRSSQRRSGLSSRCRDLGCSRHHSLWPARTGVVCWATVCSLSGHRDRDRHLGNAIAVARQLGEAGSTHGHVI